MKEHITNSLDACSLCVFRLNVHAHGFCLGIVHLTRDQLRLYSIIWERFVSSQMNNAKTKTVSVDIQSGAALFRVSGTKVIQKGFLKALKFLVPA